VVNLMDPLRASSSQDGQEAGAEAQAGASSSEQLKSPVRFSTLLSCLYLERKCGEVYLGYRSRVRRWL
jgi:hypothetical protein